MDNELTIQLNLRINPALKDKLEKLAKSRLTSKSALLREALIELFAKYGVDLDSE
jgi:predicted transcriptional regulator